MSNHSGRKRASHRLSALPKAPPPSATFPVSHSVLLVIVCLVVYARALGNGFVSDDNFQLLNNPAIREFAKIHRAFSTNVWAFAGVEAGNYYRPLQMSLYAVIYAAVGFHAASYHAANLALHCLATLLVYGLSRRMDFRPVSALLSALLFAVHPIHSEAVFWIAAIPDVLMSFFTVAAMYLFARWNGQAEGRRAASLAALYLAALFSKETGAVLMPLMVGYEILSLDRRWRELARNLALYGFMIAAFGSYLALRYYALGGLLPGQGASLRLSPTEFFLSAVVAAGKYLAMLLLPFNLNYHHDFRPTSGISMESLIAFAELTLIVTGILWLRKQYRPVSYSLFWILVSMAPALNLTGIGPNLIGERYLYLPSVGFVLLIAYGWECLEIRLTNAQKRATRVAIACVLMAACLQIYNRAADWRNDLTLFQRTAEQSPRAGAIRGYLGWLYFNRGQVEQAISEYRISLQLDPASALNLSNLANALLAKGDYDGAISQARKALTLDANRPETHLILGMALDGKGESAAAASEYQAALRLKSRYAEALTAFGLLKYNQGQLEHSIALYREAVRANPQFAVARMNLGMALVQTRRYADAVEELESALELAPRHPQRHLVHFNLALAFRELKIPERAAAELRAALALQPDFQEAREELLRLNARVP